MQYWRNEKKETKFCWSFKFIEINQLKVELCNYQGDTSKLLIKKKISITDYGIKSWTSLPLSIMANLKLVVIAGHEDSGRCACRTYHKWSTKLIVHTEDPCRYSSALQTS